jgi:alkylhydroperoxidase family enzyme
MKFRLLRRLDAYRQIMSKPNRNKTDLLRYLVRRPAILAAVSTYETAVLVSNKVDPRVKTLAALRASSVIGCPF